MLLAVSPASSASVVCISTQNARPVICEARNFTSSYSERSIPSFATAVSNATMARIASGDATAKSRRDSTMFSQVSSRTLSIIRFRCVERRRLGHDRFSMLAVAAFLNIAGLLPLSRDGQRTAGTERLFTHKMKGQMGKRDNATKNLDHNRQAGWLARRNMSTEEHTSELQ